MQAAPIPPTIETRTATVRRAESGIVEVTIRERVVQSVADARANIDAASRAVDHLRSPILVDISHAEPLEAEVRRIYTGNTVVESFEALALCIDASRLGVMMANVYLRIARLGIPTRIFTDTRAASAWLLERRPHD